MSELQTITLEHEGASLSGRLALPAGPGPHPGVLVMHNAYGRGKQVHEAARRLAEAGYAALATDLYGDGGYSEDHGVIARMIRPLRVDPKLQRDRIVAWHDKLKSLDMVDAARTGAIGFCFGGECVLELARSGADAKVVVSYHGLLPTPMPAEPGAVKAFVAVYTGAKDPHVPRQDVEGLRAEMVAAGARWQITEFGDAYHAFTDVDANTPEDGRNYDPLSHRMSWNGTLTLLEDFLE